MTKDRILRYAGWLAVVVVPTTTSAYARTLVINDFGAKGDGVAIDTVAIQRALDAAAGKHNVDLHGLNCAHYQQPN